MIFSLTISATEILDGQVGVAIEDGNFSFIDIVGNTHIYNNDIGVHVDGDQFPGIPFSGIVSVADANVHSNGRHGLLVENITSSGSTKRINAVNSRFAANGLDIPLAGNAIQFFNADVPFEIANNDIGTISPTQGAGNAAGIVIQHSDTTQASEIRLNRINGSTYDGIFLVNSNLPQLIINDNAIGTDQFFPDFNYSLPNNGNGVWLSNSIIQEIIGNTIAFNGGSGIFLNAGTTSVDIEQNVILANAAAGVRMADSNTVANGTLRNVFSQNGGLAIELETVSGPGITANDPEDVDVGPNTLLNFPEFVNSSDDGAGNWTVTYDIDVDKQGFYYVEFYRYNGATKTYQPVADLSDPQNPVYAADLIFPTIATEIGRERFQTEFTANFGLTAGEQIVATLTAVTGDNTGNTSEFALPITLAESTLRVVDIKMSGLMPNGQLWVRAPYSYASIVPTGKQLAPIYTSGVNKLEVVFNKDVQQSQLTSDNVKLYTSNGQTIALPTPSYSSATNTATWSLSSELPLGKYRLEILNGVTDLAGGALDGEWVNDANGTLDNFADDPTDRLFVSGNGIAGGKFEFFFSVLPGDYNQDGSVRNSDLSMVKDGTGDNVIGQADSDLVNTNNGQMLPLRVNNGDYHTDDDLVDTADYWKWRENYGNNVPEYDGNGNGVLDAADYVIWRAHEDEYSAWYTGPLPGGGGGSSVMVLIGEAPRVTNVVVSGSNSYEPYHPPYSFDAHVGSGEQLRTVPVGGADTVSITFNEDVNIQSDHLMFVGLRTASRPAMVEFEYDIATMTATWRFDDLIANDHYVIQLSDAVTDIEGNPLDGEWVNPASLSTTNPLVSEFPSGDGQAGGDFTFVITLLAGDASLDNLVNNTDYNIFYSLLGADGVFQDGEFEGDGIIAESDYQLYLANEGLDLRDLWLLADLNGDGSVDEADLDIIYGNEYMSNPTQADGDMNGDGYVSFADLELAFAQFGLQLAIAS